MPDTPLGFIDYPAENDQNWYSGSDGLETWLSRVELLGIPTYATFSDLPAAGNRPTASGTDGTQRQFAAVAADRTVYRDDGTEWVPWFGKGTSSRPLPNTSHFEAISTDSATVNTTLTDPANVDHTGELADSSDVSSIQSSSDVDHDSTAGGTNSSTHHTKTSSASELTDVSADSVSGAHHSRYTGSESRSAIEAGDVNGVQFFNYEQGEYDRDGLLYWDLGEGLYIKSSNAPNTKTGGRLIWSGANVSSGNAISLSYDSSDKPTIAVDVVASGTVTLSSGQATIDTGIATTTTATFMPAAAPATNDADVAADVRADSGSGNYEIDIQETDTDVGNPDVYYDIIRVR
jgi:uncharacterized protein YaiE (UPF0345 family)